MQPNLACLDGTLPETIKNQTHKIFHFVFNKEDGLFSCQVNDMGFEGLKNAIQEIMQY